jgi:hypothetical protein
MPGKRRTYYLVLAFAILAEHAGFAQEQPFVAERAPFSNRSYNEYSPVVLDSAIILRADKQLNAMRKSADSDDHKAMNIFRIRMLANGEWSEPELFSQNLSDIQEHHGPAVFDREGERIWYNKIIDESDPDRTKIGIYTSTLTGGEWGEEEPFEYNDPRYNYYHPYLSEDGRMLFFASDMRGGLGGFDIYVCYRRNERWTEPVNLGPNINTSRNEIYPIYYPDGRLYFSSRGHDPNLGGYDIYYSVRDVGEWSPVMHLPPPFNSRRNEASFTLIDTSYTRGYFHSDREARIYNIFEFSLDIPPEIFEECKPQEENSYCFTFYEAGKMDIDTTQFRYEWVIEDRKFRQEEVDYCFAGVGRYIIVLNVIDLLSDEVLFNEATYELDIEDIEQVYISSADTVLVNESFQLNSHGTFIKDFTIDRYVWDMGDKNWISSDNIQHTYFKPGTYTVKLGITNAADQPEEMQKTCGYKKVIVLPR